MCYCMIGRLVQVPQKSLEIFGKCLEKLAFGQLLENLWKAFRNLQKIIKKFASNFKIGGA